MPTTIAKLEEVLKNSPPPRPTEPVAQADAEALRWRLEKDLAPVAAKNALLALLDEARQTRWIALVSLAVSIATLLVVLLRG